MLILHGRVWYAGLFITQSTSTDSVLWCGYVLSICWRAELIIKVMAPDVPAKRSRKGK
jgi:hypothetical protein